MSSSTGAERTGLIERLCGTLYDGAWGAIALATKPLFFFGSRRWREKAGHYAEHEGHPHCWIHACSVGEVRVALLCLEEIRRHRPRFRFTLSTVTPEGFLAAHSGVVDPRDKVVFFPFDARGIMSRAYNRLRPDFVVLTEVELWPNHLREAARRQVPVFIINGRLTGQDVKNYRRAGRFMRRTFSVPELVCARGSAEADRFERLGAPHVITVGDMKYETLTSSGTSGGNRELLLVLGASTHEGEEEILLRALKKLWREFAHLRLVLAPRHPQRAASIAKIAAREGFKPSFSSLGEPQTEVLIIDEIGRLKSWYAKATLCFVGKSLCGRGGQNFLEPAACGCPVITGPHLENFPEAAERLLAKNAMVSVPDAAGLERALDRLLRNQAERDRMAAAARDVIRENSGATRRTVELILARLGSRI